MEVNNKAPAVASGTIPVDADPESIWEILTSLEQWPDWNPDVKKVVLSGDLAPGTKFRWKTGSGTIRSTLRQIEKPDMIGWTGKIFGIHAIHIWRLEPKDGDTLVRTEESWEGLLVNIFRKSMQKMLQQALDSGLDYLKEAAERRSTS